MSNRRKEGCQPEWAGLSNRRNYEVGEIEIEHRIAPRTADETARLLWQLLQRDWNREHYHMGEPERPREYAIRDDGPLCEPIEGKVFSGQL